MIARELAAWGTGAVDVPQEVRAAATRHFLDGIGNAVGAFRTGAVDSVLHVARSLGGPPEATVLGAGDRLTAPAAGLANGSLVHALDFDDTHADGLVHATAVVLPATLAVAEQVGATGAQAMTTAVVGYETACRVASAAPHGFHARGLHATMVAGVFSSALVTSRLIGLEEVRATHALGIAGSQAGGLLAFLGTAASTKQLHPGFASQAGIMAARLAAAGATGPETVFDGPYGVFDALAAGPVDASTITADLGVRWETTRIGIKPYPACQLSHATLGAVADAMHREEFTADDVTRVHARVHPDSATVVCDASRDLASPTTPYAAKFSLPWSAAALIVDGVVGVDTYSDASLTRSEISRLAARVGWEPIDSPTTVAADAPGDVVVSLRDGREVHGHVERSEGTEGMPLSYDALVAKFEGNIGGQAPDLVRAVEDIDEHSDVSTLMDLVVAASRIDSEAVSQ